MMNVLVLVLEELLGLVLCFPSWSGDDLISEGEREAKNEAEAGPPCIRERGRGRPPGSWGGARPAPKTQPNPQFGFCVNYFPAQIHRSLDRLVVRTGASQNLFHDLNTHQTRDSRSEYFALFLCGWRRWPLCSVLHI